MGFLLLSGDKANLLESANAVAMSSEDSLYPAANLYDQELMSFARFASPAAADEHITIDLRALANGGFEDWTGGAPDGWTVVTTGTGASVTQETTIKHSGTSSAKLTAGTGTPGALVRKDVTVRSGERRRAAWALYGDGSNATWLRIQNLHTGLYLNSSGAWVSSPTDLAAQTAAAWATGNLAFTVEGMDVTRRNLVTLRVEASCTAASGIGYVDDLELVPGVTFLGVFGHNVDALVTPQLRKSSDNFVADDNLVDAPTVYLPGFFSTITETFSPYWRLKLSGGPNVSGAIWIGELVLGQYLEMQDAPEYGYETGRRRRQVRSLSASGARQVRNRNVYAERGLRLQFSRDERASYEEALREIYERTEDGLYPVIVIPDSAEREVFHGYVDPDWPVRRSFFTNWQDPIMIAESAYPSEETT